MVDKIKLVEEQLLRKDLPKFNVGDQLKVFTKILEADKVRIHRFEGSVIRKRGQGMSSTFTMRKTSFGEGVERTFPLNSPAIDKIEVIKKGKVRRAKLYYLREKIGKATKIKEA
ncbi:MAG: 50S ribosomal protein L19 [Candidatus Omnitrophota bacterium]